ncbi:MAG: hypothetical protein U0T77_00200 [Chitinophagales bacterium]
MYLQRKEVIKYMAHKLNDILSTLIDTHKSDYFLFSAEINNPNADKFINILRNKKNRKHKCSLILTTNGGIPDSGYRIIRAIKRFYQILDIYVFGYCKSTGTLMALGADEIIMSDFGEFGPLDIQLVKDDELYHTSGLNIVQALRFLNDNLFQSFEKDFLSVKEKSANTITTKTAGEIATKLAIGLVAPISAQIDPVKLGEVQRAMQIAHEYGKRLCSNNELIAQLIVGYPSHGFVIDFEEAKKSFPNVRWVSDDEKLLEQFLIKLVRSETKEDFVMELLLEEKPVEEKPIVNSQTIKKTKNESTKSSTTRKPTPANAQ